VRTDGAFAYASWIAGLRAGRTFISNGPLLELSVAGKGPGERVDLQPGPVAVSARALSRLAFDRLQIVHDGAVVAEALARGQREARLEVELPVTRGGWLAARVSSSAKTHSGYTVFAHTSPVYVQVAGTPARRASDAGAFVDEIEESLRFIRKSYRFANEADRAIALGRFQQGRDFYARLVAAK
jgi:hypothetical protein